MNPTVKMGLFRFGKFLWTHRQTIAEIVAGYLAKKAALLAAKAAEAEKK